MTEPALSASEKGPGKRATIVMSLVAVLCILIPLLFWHGTWFGRALTDEQISEYLGDNHDQPRRTQHALVQISERMSRGEASVKEWYPQLLSLADHSLPELRLTVAWVMGQDNQNEQFHDKLRELLRDANPMVRRNAALSLSRFGDAAGRTELLAMLQPHTITAGTGGVISNRLQQGDVADRGTLLVRVEVEGEPEPAEIRSEVPGVVRKQLKSDGDAVQPGEGVTLLGPDPGHAFEALRGLYLVGVRDDIETIRPFLMPSENNPAHVAEQARLTIEKLSGNSGP
ncbi:MAG: HEAT repeat domain-containing protein [Bryobacterales bacterium]